MKILFIILLYFVFTEQCLSQLSMCDSIYTIADEMPKYKSGDTDLFRDIRMNFRYNEACKTEELRQIIWIISDRGKVLNVDLVGLESECKNDIIRQSKLLTEWKPGKIRGKPVCIKVTLLLHIRPD